MHHCLQVAEIVSEVVEYIALDHGLGQLSLGMLARTCKLLQDPCLDVLWRELYDLKPLLNCLPEDAWGEIPVESSRRVTIKLHRDLVQRDLDRFVLYAPRVRLFGKDSFSPRSTVTRTVTVLDPGVYPALALVAPKGPLLPQLRGLIWSEEHEVDFSNIRYLLGPQLGSLRLNISTNLQHSLKDTSHPIAQFLPSLAPNIAGLHLTARGLHLTGGHESNWTSDLTLSLVRSCQNLQERFLSLPSLSPEIFDHLLTSPSLRKLILIGYRGAHSWFPPFPSTLGPDTFRALTHLEINIGEVDKLFGLSIIRALHLSPINSILLDFQSELTAADLSQLIGALDHHRGARTTLTTLHIRSLPASRFPGQTAAVAQGEPLIIPSTLEPLLALAHLEELRINMQMGWSITDAFMERMARAWPRIRRLSLVCGWWTGTAAQIGTTPASLMPFARYCPRLEVLGLPMNTEGFAWTAATGNGAATESGVRVLEVGEARVADKDVGDAAVYLTRMFPGCMNSKYLPQDHPRANGAQAAFWARVRFLVLRARMEERKGVNLK